MEGCGEQGGAIGKGEGGSRPGITSDRSDGYKIKLATALRASMEEHKIELATALRASMEELGARPRRRAVESRSWLLNLPLLAARQRRRVERKRLCRGPGRSPRPGAQTSRSK